MTQDQITQLRARIVRDFNLGNLPEPAQDLVIGGVVENVLLAITRATLERLPTPLRPRFDELTAAGDEDGMQHFLEEAIPGYDKLVTNVVDWVMNERKNPVVSSQKLAV